jgi:hypothetical protein
MTLSLLAFVGSLFLFVFATFAWFLVSEWVNVDPNNVRIVDVNVAAILFESDNGIDYTETNSIDFSSQQPGATKYYKLSLENTGNVAENIKVSLYGFSDGASDSEKPYDDTKSLRDVTFIAISNSLNQETYSDYVAELLPVVPSGDYTNQALYLTIGLTLSLETTTGDIFFNFTLPGDDLGNDYQNLKMVIATIIISAIKE